MLEAFIDKVFDKSIELALVSPSEHDARTFAEQLARNEAANRARSAGQDNALLIEPTPSDGPREQVLGYIAQIIHRSAPADPVSTFVRVSPRSNASRIAQAR